MIKIYKTQNGSKIYVNKDEQVVLHLAENPTTGYIWEVLDYSKTNINFLKSEYTPNLDSEGAAGVRKFYFKIIGIGVSTIIISLCQPWNHESIEQFSISIVS
ncbi:MAG: protease inhibitor I42 family protein [Saprospiraceae bacterium]